MPTKVFFDMTIGARAASRSPRPRPPGARVATKKNDARGYRRRAKGGYPAAGDFFFLDPPVPLSRRCRGGPHRDDAPRGRRAQDGGELPRAVHRREGLRVQGLVVPPRDHAVHVPGRRLHEPQRHRRQVHLRREVRRRELPAQAHRTGCAVDGQRRPRHQRQPVLPLHRQDGLARW